ncbi:antilisterial bacteriocin subtilosin biosynthesis protein AlbA [Clostridium saccharobutylicum]|uniref:Antilisterial bacteriocin subtilosin biosynthesis protein AlbA n=1 Tax=Clostridium saccharobutylicum TaxID=169679 RepID=A0A1S8N617_CLOSA|nr:antilisterial bacteriocin subtilosin biosynthesis protein AlbA [Clostridium saccharobutylicum]
MYPIINNILRIKLQPIGAGIYLCNEKRQLQGILQINSTALEILKLCNGKNSLDEIKKKLLDKYNEEFEKISNLVDDFINMSIKIGTISSSETILIEEKNLLIQGSNEYWSPSVVSLELTHKCPLRCKHCYINAGEGKNMQDDLIIPLEKEIKELNVDIVQLTGGEPLLHTRITNIIEYLVNNNIQVQIMTSGMINDYNINQYIKMINKTHGFVQVSIDGLRETHNKFRGNKDSFDNAIKFISTIINLGVVVNVSTCFSDQSKGEIEQLCSYLKEIGVTTYRIGTISEIGRAKNNNVFSSTNKVHEMRELKQYLANKFDDKNFTVSFIDDKDEDNIKLGCTNCGYGHNFIKIDPIGDFYPCVLSEKPVGNYFDKNIKEFMLSKKNVYHNILQPSKDICKDCELEPLCHNCINSALINSKYKKDCNWLNSQKDKINILL